MHSVIDQPIDVASQLVLIQATMDVQRGDIGSENAGERLLVHASKIPHSWRFGKRGGYFP